MRRPLIAVSAAAALFVAASVATPPAAAEGAPTAEEIRLASDEFDKGKLALAEDEFEDAAARFEAADRHAPSATALGAALHSRNEAGQLDRAATLAELAKLRHADDAQIKTLATAILKRASRELHRLTVTCDDPCEIIVGTRLQHGGAFDERAIFLAPGSHEVRAGWSEGRTEKRKVSAEKGGSGSLEFEAPPIPDPEDEPAVSPAAKRPRKANARRRVTTDDDGLPPSVFWIGTGLTVVTGGLSVWSGIDTQNNPGPDLVREKCAGLGTACTEYKDGVARQDRTNVLLAMTGGLAVVTIVIGAGFTSWGSPSDAEADTAMVEPLVSVGDGALVGASGRF